MNVELIVNREHRIKIDDLLAGGPVRIQITSLEVTDAKLPTSFHLGTNVVPFRKKTA